MTTATKSARPAPRIADNALARNAMDAIEQIDRDAKTKKLAQLKSLESAKSAIHERMNELNHQMDQLDGAIASINGTAVLKENRERRHMSEVRDRVLRWMVARKGEKFGAAELVKGFPELEGTPVSIFLRSLVVTGKIGTDASAGMRRTKYFAVS